MRALYIIFIAIVLLPFSAVGAPLSQTLPNCFSGDAHFDAGIPPSGAWIITVETGTWYQFEINPSLPVDYAGQNEGGSIPADEFSLLPIDGEYTFYTFSGPWSYEYCYSLPPDTPTPTLTPVPVVTVTPTPTPTVTPTLTPEQALVELQMYSLAWQTFVGVSLLIAVGLLVLRVRM